MEHTHHDCLSRSHHHCQHAHQCTNPNHSKSKSRSHQKTIPIKTKPISRESRQRNHQFSEGNIKTRCRQTSPHDQAVLDKLAFGLQEKQRRIQQLEQQLAAVRNRKSVQQHASSPSPACMVKKEDYQAMYRYVQFENQRLALEAEEMKALRDICQLELEIQRQKAKKLEHSLVQSTISKERLAFLETQLARLSSLRKEHELLLHNFKKQQQQLTDLKNKLTIQTNSKEKSKETTKGMQQMLKRLTEEKELIKKERESIKIKYEQHAKHNIELTQKLKEIKERNRISLEQLQEECKEKVRNADIKFGFSCDQISNLRNSETKLKARVKELEETLRNKSQKEIKTKQTKIEKQLRSMYERSTKDNETLRQKSLRYQQQNEQLKDTLRELRTKSEQSNKQTHQLLKLKDLENQKLQTARLQTEQQIRKLRQLQKNFPNEFKVPPGAGENGAGKNDTGRKEIGFIPGQDKGSGASGLNPERASAPGGLEQLFGGKENQDIFSGGSSTQQIIIIKKLQQKNAILEGEVESMRGRLNALDKQGSSWAQFEGIIKQNNRRIKELIIQKGKQVETNSHLKVQIEQLRGRLQQPRETVDTATNQLYQRNLEQLRRLRNQLADRDFELVQLRKQVYEVNNQYSDYYILREDNQALKTKIAGLTQLIETLRRSGIHNSYQKQELILQNQYLTEQLDRSRGLLL